MIDIFVDIDGVINAVAKNPPRKQTGWDDELWRQERVNGYLITWNEELIDIFNEIFLNPNVRPVFLTTWQDMARDLLAPVVGLNASTWKVLKPKDQQDLYSLNNGWWKFQVLKEELTTAGTKKFVWLDDDIKFENNASRWVNNESLIGNTVAISPRTEHGLTKTHLHAIINFINEQ